MMTRLLRTMIRLCLIWSVCSMATLNAQDVRLSVDRTTVFLGDTLSLTIDMIDPKSAADLQPPDWSLLGDDFLVTNTGNTSIVNLENGQKSTRLSHTAMIEPTRAGTLTIPAFTLGGVSTEPMTITVMEREANSDAAQATEDLFVEAEVDHLDPYVQQLVLLKVRLYHASSILEGSLSYPELDNAVVTKLQQEDNYRTRINDRTYRVIERTYLVFPEKSGPLQIPALVFEGRISNNSQRLLYNRGSRITASSDPITLTVKPVPASYTGSQWMPSTDVQIREQWSEAVTEMRVGEPVTRSIELKVRGQLSTQIPTLEAPNESGYRIYPDDEITRTRGEEKDVVGEKEVRWAIVPTTEGTITLPEIRIPWWDVERDQERVAIIPARQITVVAGPNAAITESAISDSPAMAPEQSGGQAGAPPHSGLWPMVAAAAVLGWLLTSWALIRRINALKAQGVSPSQTARTGHPERPAHAHDRRAFRTACQTDQPRQAERQLLAWARAEGVSVHSLGALRHQLNDAQQQSEIDRLNDALYRPGASQWHGAPLYEAFREGMSLVRLSSPQQDDRLPPLYAAQ